MPADPLRRELAQGGVFAARLNDVLGAHFSVVHEKRHQKLKIRSAKNGVAAAMNFASPATHQPTCVFI